MQDFSLLGQLQRRGNNCSCNFHDNALEKWTVGARAHLACMRRMLYMNIIDSDCFLRVIGPINLAESCLSYRT